MRMSRAIVRRAKCSVRRSFAGSEVERSRQRPEARLELGPGRRMADGRTACAHRPRAGARCPSTDIARVRSWRQARRRTHCRHAGNLRRHGMRSRRAQRTRSHLGATLARGFRGFVRAIVLDEIANALPGDPAIAWNALGRLREPFDQRGASGLRLRRLGRRRELTVIPPIAEPADAHVATAGASAIVQREIRAARTLEVDLRRTCVPERRAASRPATSRSRAGTRVTSAPLRPEAPVRRSAARQSGSTASGIARSTDFTRGMAVEREYTRAALHGASRCGLRTASRRRLRPTRQLALEPASSAVAGNPIDPDDRNALVPRRERLACRLCLVGSRHVRARPSCRRSSPAAQPAVTTPAAAAAPASRMPTCAGCSAPLPRTQWRGGARRRPALRARRSSSPRSSRGTAFSQLATAGSSSACRSRYGSRNGGEQLTLLSTLAARDSVPVDRPSERGERRRRDSRLRSRRLRDQVVLIDAHYDHLGIQHGQAGDSIYNGADDDASGVVAVMEIARALAAGPAAQANRRRRSHDGRGGRAARHTLVHRTPGSPARGDGGEPRDRDDRTTRLARRRTGPRLAHGLRAIDHGRPVREGGLPIVADQPARPAVLHAERQHCLRGAGHRGAHAVVVQHA